MKAQTYLSLNLVNEQNKDLNNYSLSSFLY